MDDQMGRDPGYDATIGDEGRTVVVASFRDRSSAEAAIERLRDTGYARDEIGFATRDESGRDVVVDEETDSAGPGAVGGAVTGAVSGGTLAWLGLAALPAIGPFLAAGAVGTALLAAGAGAVTGGVLGGLLGLGIPRHRAEYHHQQLEQGLSLVTVRTGEPLVVERLLNEAGAVEVDRADDHSRTVGGDTDNVDVRADDQVLADRDR